MGYFGPTYPSIRDIFFPTIQEAGEMLGFRVEVRESNKEVHLYRGREYYGTIICRSMDKPNSIVGFKIAISLVDEIDILPADKAQNAWDKIISRMRLEIPGGVINTIGVTTTPEGFKFVYDRFADNPTESYSMVQASSMENAQYLPSDYISSLEESYTPELVQAYVKGLFVNLTSGTIYSAYNRKLNGCQTIAEPGERLHIGLDFNVGKMAGRVHVIREGLPHAVGEIDGVLDTPAMIVKIREKYPSHLAITIYPDSSGDSRKTTNASQTDISLLQEAGFHCVYAPANPAVKNRINAMNAMFCNAKGERRYFVNEHLCPKYAKDLERQTYDEKTGEPEKKSAADHGNDAAGDFIYERYPVIRKVPTISHRWQ